MADVSAFQDYERELLRLTSSLPTRINQLLQYTTDNDAGNTEVRRIEQDLTQAKQRLGDMEMEARSIPEPTRRELGNKIRTYKDSLGNVARDLDSAKQKFSRSALMSGAGGANGGRAPTDFDKSRAERDRMMQTTDKLRGGTDTLNSAHARLEETIQVGQGTMEELSRNAETLNRVRGNVGIVSGTLDEARTVLRRMTKREMRTKLAVAVFAVVLLAIIIGLIAYLANRNSPA